MRVGAKTLLGIALMLAAIVMALTSVYLFPYETASSGPDWESKKCMRDTREVRPFAFAVCYDRNGESLR
jgi:hypothetical protein